MLDEGPSKLYDAVARVLGLDDLVEADAALSSWRKDRQKATKQVKGGSIRGLRRSWVRGVPQCGHGGRLRRVIPAAAGCASLAARGVSVEGALISSVVR